MIEKTVLDYLSAAFSHVSVSMEKPSPLLPTYIVIEKTGSGRENRLRSATLAIQSVAPTLFEAASLSDDVIALMDELPRVSSNVFRVDCDSDYNFTDTETKEPRYQAVFNIYYIEE